MRLPATLRSLLSRLSVRASPENPSVSFSSWLDTMDGVRSATGLTVSPQTALASTAVCAAVRVIAESVAQLPIDVFRRDGTKRVQQPNHTVAYLLGERPNPEMTAFAFRELLTANVALWGNGYAEIELDRAGRPKALWPLMPSVTRPIIRNGVKSYVTEISGQQLELPGYRVFHIPGFGFDGLVGYSRITLAREAVGLTLAAEQFGSAFFGNGSRMSGVLKHPGALDEPSAKRLAQSWREMHAGLNNAHRIAVLEAGMEWQQIGVPPDDAQFLQTRKFQVTEIARLFGVPPHMLADLDRATFSNIEQQALEFLKYSLSAWLVRWEQVANYALMSKEDRGRVFVRHNLNALLRGDSASRTALYTALMDRGVYSINDVLALEDLNPIEGGDVRLVQGNMVPLDQAGQQVMGGGSKVDPTAVDGGSEGDAAPPAGTQRAAQWLLKDAVSRVQSRALSQKERAERRCEPASSLAGELSDYAERTMLPAMQALAELSAPLTPERDAFVRRYTGALAHMVADEILAAAGVPPDELATAIAEREALAALAAFTTTAYRRAA